MLSIGLNIYFVKNKIVPSQKETQTKLVTITGVIDGDTFDTNDGERIRLFEIDAPEYPKGCMGVDAKARLETLILNKKVAIEKIKKDNFGRILGYIYLDKLLLNEVLTEEGHFTPQRCKVIFQRIYTFLMFFDNLRCQQQIFYI
ncbi:hypothetical protein COS31_04970 [Candidatus Roizmanbacteria bacterium CG02_land_8_20_14_3_00_36_15]|uniref:TNase-like domain-containing protein n=2 Tax=Candidatus Roizmaniibacteriota TaxID=1752723 RepID=A0A2M8KLA8_9BACT|nr:MAG: hypothetical protein COS51_05015 [Candidatus Roizmanbacteria bacterium CG03_land_8_20_14_0_80_36_21]PIV37369.1 MAG: hypothetical protein COS31_04970 [Candidatus Roizmanbacteria bacterium CG02_land_8_20_14_3_00_36_15]PJA52704.1 MAG: hypothetical protein CO166_04585 [Candidatus Roizmanbacteria bacterium CG_4_9_14_3_um_filter_36_11]PJC81388.1 MAG: hypothetical protein CO007_04970 [Candidatus Roizmanbacteria bacterium CG_4_8_14_3_um_filter_36_10]PJE60684.1 MAG: hypothetical protein COU86_02